MNEIKFFKGSIDKWNQLSKNENYFYIVLNGNMLELFLGNKLIAKSSTPNDLLLETNRAISIENNLQSQIDDIKNGSSIDVNLTNYYTKNEVDNLIPKNYLTEVPSEYITESELNGKKYMTLSEVEMKISELVDSAPDTLNTLNELASALDNDPNFATTIATQIGSKADMTVVNELIQTINDKYDKEDVYTKAEVDNLITKVLNTPT